MRSALGKDSAPEFYTQQVPDGALGLGIFCFYKQNAPMVRIQMTK